MLFSRSVAVGGSNEVPQGGAPPASSGGVESLGGDGPTEVEDQFWTDDCTPEVVFINLDTSATGEAVAAQAGDTTQLLQSAAQTACRVFYRNASEAPEIDSVSLTLEAFDGAGSVGGTQIRLSTTYLANFDVDSGAMREELDGLVHFFLAHIYQHSPASTPGWLTSGKADFVRLEAGLVEPSTRSVGGSWTSGFERTAFFLQWLTMTDADFVYELNQRSAPGEPPYSDERFEDLTGTDLPTLWDEYQTSIE